jgi:hypothetical protein
VNFECAVGDKYAHHVAIVGRTMLHGLALQEPYPCSGPICAPVGLKFALESEYAVPARMGVLGVQHALRIADHADFGAVGGVFTKHQASQIDAQFWVVAYVPFDRFGVDDVVRVRFCVVV